MHVSFKISMVTNCIEHYFADQVALLSTGRPYEILQHIDSWYFLYRYTTRERISPIRWWSLCLNVSKSSWPVDNFHRLGKMHFVMLIILIMQITLTDYSINSHVYNALMFFIWVWSLKIIYKSYIGTLLFLKFFFYESIFISITRHILPYS